MLGAWLTSLALKDHPRRIARTATAIVIGAVVGASVLSVGSVAEEANRAGLLADWRRLPERFGERVRQLQDRPWEFQMTPTVRALRPFLAYVTRCTTLEDRLLSVGFPPDVFFFARRLVAGGQTYFGSFGNVEAQQRRVVARLERQRVPFVLVPSDFAGEFDERFPTVAAYVRAHFVPMSRVPVDDDVQMQIYLNRDLPYFSRDPDTGFPCYFQNGHSSPVDGRR
jgi:hypothetical protein